MFPSNDKKVTKHVLETYRFFDLCNYRTTCILSLILAYIANINVWIYAELSIPLFLIDLIYAFGMLSGAVGVVLNNIYGIIGVLIKHLIDLLAICSFLSMEFAQKQDTISISTNFYIVGYGIMEFCLVIILSKIVWDATKYHLITKNK